MKTFLRISSNVFSMAFVCLWIVAACELQAADSVCVGVQVEIDQTLTLERQGFNASMTIKNGLADQALQNVSVTLNFLDANQQPVLATTSSTNTNAKFFYQMTSSAVTQIPATGSGKMTWQIIPAAGASGTDPQGTLYYVGATLKYTAAGSDQEVNVTPDYIFVKPMPDITLEYFLKEVVYGDDPFTPGIVEPIVPFSLGVRVKNNGYGTASKLKIDSGQPYITDNPQGLAVEFKILGSEVQGATASPSLLVDFGDVASGKAKAARWLMTSSLMGTFSFSASMTHADELGGEVTSLVNIGGAHLLVQDVLVDLPGRDSVRDFFAHDGGTYRVYESDGVDSDVLYQEYGTVPVGSGSAYTATAPASAGFVAVRYVDPFSGTKDLSYALRTDGKILNPANAWLAKIWDRNVHKWNYYVYIFDIGNSGGGWSYTLYFGPANHTPVLSGVTDRIVQAGTALTMAFSATSPDGAAPVISTSALPAGAVFSGGSATGSVTWTPTTGQVGSYPFRVTATNGSYATSKTATITVTTQSLHQAWKDKYWPGVTDLNIIGNSADPDHDGLSNLLEYALNLDPTKLNADEGIVIGMDEVDGKRYLTLTYTARTDDPALQMTVVGANEANAPEASWQVQTQSVTVDQADVPTGMQRVKVRDSVEIGSSTLRRFLKVRVTINEN